MGKISGKRAGWIWAKLRGLRMSRDLTVALKRHQAAADALDAAVKEMLKP